jgi:hypothetical protein
MLKHRVAVIIPSTVKGNEPAPADLVAKWVKAAKIKLGTLFGGFTATKGEGGWVSPVHGLIEEPVTVVAAHCDEEAFNRHAQDVREFALTVAVALEQEAVSVQFDNTLEFVSVPPAVAVNVV